MTNTLNNFLQEQQLKEQCRRYRVAERDNILRATLKAIALIDDPKRDSKIDFRRIEMQILDFYAKSDCGCWCDTDCKFDVKEKR